MFTSAEDIRRCLTALGARLEAEDRPAVSFLICGGSALSLSGLMTRTTVDVDSLGLVGEGAVLERLPDWILEITGRMADELGLEETWFNDAASSLHTVGLPEGMLTRARREAFGSRLEVAVASRIDLVALKCFAALDPKAGEKHLGDLVELAPTPDEFTFTAGWLLARPTSPQFRQALGRLFTVLGGEPPE